MYYSYTVNKEKKWGFRREYKGSQLRKKGFSTKADAEAKLRELMYEIDNPVDELATPTTLQMAFGMYKVELESRGVHKSIPYNHSVTSVLNVLQTFVDSFGSDSLVKDIKELDLRGWYQSLQLRGISQASASSHIGRLGGLLKYAQEHRPDLATWNRPKLKNIKARLVNPGRIVDDEEYRLLVNSLLNPPKCFKYSSRKSLWRDAADAVRLLRNTGGRLNEVLRLRLDQLNMKNGTVKLYATKTEDERTNPLSISAQEVILRRIKEGLTGDNHLFARASGTFFHGHVEKACREAAKVAGLRYGRKTPGGFTLHGLRHTFITDLLARGVDIPTVMALSGHKSLRAFSTYLHATEFGKRKAAQVINSIDVCLEEPSAVNEICS